ncbi:hypothetical protein KY290_003824 [Solanum tuberosum]|uniref:Uncharacterized protein n=1 Tax=Solanum tuberosum TaxID=4113 RepID=A0ABQ7WTZ5_SOLTU|nr:hypothetical protein KY290_003824 [Solanum tuberosum]
MKMWHDKHIVPRTFTPGEKLVLMAPKSRNVEGGAGSKRSRKGDAAGKSTASWDRSKDTGRKATLHYANLNQMARVWIKFICSVFLPAKHTSDVTREMVVLVYMLMKAEGIEKEELDMIVARTPYLICNMVDFTRTKALNTVATLDGGCPITDDEMENLAECYPLTDSVAYMCRICSAFQEPLDDDEGTADEGMDEEEDDDDAYALMVFDGASDVADGRDDYDEA